MVGIAARLALIGVTATKLVSLKQINFFFESISNDNVILVGQD
jgi:hypothetical protein